MLISASLQRLQQLRIQWKDQSEASWTPASARLRNWHEDPRIIAWWQARSGVTLHWLNPTRRRLLLGATAVLVGTPQLVKAASSVEAFPLTSGVIASALALTVMLLGVCLTASARFATLPAVVRRHPQFTLHGLFWGLLLLLWLAPDGPSSWRNVLIGVALMLPLLLWRMSYLLLSGQRGKVSGTTITHHLIYLLPLQVGWFAFLPFGKGLDYLGRHEAQDEHALARTQLAGIKLILLACLWQAMLSAMEGLVYGSPNWARRALGGLAPTVLPAFGDLLAQGGHAPFWKSWLAIYLELIRRVFQVAVLGHGVVGVFRLFGFYIFRNTYKPLLSETVSQFWARLEFYYKELLVDFFFLPTFARWFRRGSPALRTFAAVFAAAFVGNTYCHLVDLDQGALVVQGLGAVWAHHSRLFYCLLLAVGIFVSMQREQRRGGQALPPGLARRAGRILAVWTFFALIRIWDHFPEVSFATRTQFFFGLFGLA
ncbi:MAG: hypothetical protein U1E63_15730 [Burkholderiales bacterium]